MTKDNIDPWLQRRYDSQYETWKRKVDAADPGYKAAADRIESFTVKTGYTVLDNGDIVDTDGNPYHGHVSDEHLRIAAERKAKA